VGRAVARVDREIEEDGHDHSSEAGEERQRYASAFAELAEIAFPPRLEPDHEEEEGHQAAVDPAAQVHRDRVAAERDRERRRPDALVRGVVDIRPEKRHKDRGEQDRRAPGLGVEIGTKRRLEVAGPRRPAAEWRRGDVCLGHADKLRKRRRFDRGCQRRSAKVALPAAAPRAAPTSSSRGDSVADKTNGKNTGKIVEIKGVVLDAVFADKLPEINYA